MGSSAMRVWFNHGEGLSYRGKPSTGFELAGFVGRFVAAVKARYSGSLLTDIFITRK